MKTSQALVITAIVVASLSLCQAAPGEGFDAWRDTQDESQSDVISNRIQERRREQLRSMSDPNCLVWSRRASKGCFLRKRSYRSRKVIFCLFCLNFLSDIMRRGSPRDKKETKSTTTRLHNIQCINFLFKSWSCQKTAMNVIQLTFCVLHD